MNHCLKVFKQLRYEDSIKETELFECIAEVIYVTQEEFDDMRET